VRTASHLAHEPLFLHLAAELPERLLELLWILDDYSHNPQRIPGGSCERSLYVAPPGGRGDSLNSARTDQIVRIDREDSARMDQTVRIKGS